MSVRTPQAVGKASVSGRTPGFRWTRVGEGHLAEWPGTLTVRVAADGHVLESIAAPGAAPIAVEKLRRGLATAFARSLSGKPSLHASAVACRDRALVCVGPSGAGKSSVAGALCRCSGVELVADDVAAIELIGDLWHALPSESSVWLLPDASEAQAVKVPAPRVPAQRATVIAMVVVLRFDDALCAPQLRGIRGARAAAELLGAVMRFQPTPEGMKRELDVVAALITQAVVLELSRPHDAPLNEVAGALLDCLERTTGTQP